MREHITFEDEEGNERTIYEPFPPEELEDYYYEDFDFEDDELDYDRFDLEEEEC